MSLLHPKVIADLDLAQARLRGAARDRHVRSDARRRPHRVQRFGREDAAAASRAFRRRTRTIYPEFDRYLMESVVDPAQAPARNAAGSVVPRLEVVQADGRRSCGNTAAIGGKLFRLIDLLTMSADDYLSEWFESTHVKAVLAYYCGIGTFVGPKSPGSAYVVMHHLMGEHAGAGGWGFIRGGMGTITQAIAAYGRAKGLEIRTDAEVIAIDTARRPRHRRHARRRHAHRGADRREQRQRQAHLPQVPAARRAARRVRARRRELPDLLHRLQDQHRVRAAAGIHRLRSGNMRLRLSDLHAHRPDDRISRARLRRREIRRLVARSVRHAGHAELRRRHDRPPGKHVVNLFGGHAPYTLREGDWATPQGRIRRRTCCASWTSTRRDSRTASSACRC